MRPSPALLLLVLLASCATGPDAPVVENGPAAMGGAVGMGQPVRVGGLVATPLALIEDSRCPENARCIWAGRLIVSTRIDGAGWREIAPLTLGEPYTTHGASIALVSGLPEKQADAATPASAYRFAFEGGE